MRECISYKTYNIEPKKGSGFFGVTEVESFFSSFLNDSSFIIMNNISVMFDLSKVRVWDSSGLLWLTLALHHSKYVLGIDFVLKLPDENSANDIKSKEHFKKSADFLRRIRFDKCLMCIDSDINMLLVKEQRNYFNPPLPRKYYKERMIEDDRGIVHALVSRRLYEVKYLSERSVMGAAEVTRRQIAKQISNYKSSRIGDILIENCDINEDIADLFADHLLTEALQNVQDHPNASIGLVAISILGYKSKELILSVVDNGDAIPRTLFNRFKKDFPNKKLPDVYSKSKIDFEDLVDIVTHSTKEGVTSRKEYTEKDGKGLTYILDDTVNEFGGKLTIVTDGVQVSYYNEKGESKVMTISSKKATHFWPGNLLRISIPIK